MSNSVFTNNLRLEEIASGERSGTWGTATNTNISLITDAFAFGTEAITTNATAHSTNMEDADETQTGAPRSMYLKYTGTLNATCTVTLGPNSVSKVWIIENATSGSQILTIKQGTGSSVNIPNGSVKVVYSDGGGTGANVVDAFTDLDVAGTFAVAGNTTVGGTFTSTGAVTANAGVSIDNITIDGTEIDLSSGDLTLDVAGDIVLNSDDGIIFLKDDSATFGSLNNNSGNLIIKSGTTTAATFSGANVTLAGTVVTGGLTTLGGNLVIPNAGNIGSVGDTDAISISSSGVVTLTQNLIIPDGGNIGAASDTDAISISSGGVVTMNQIPVFSAGINVSGGSIAGSLSSTTQGNITATGALNSGSITSGFGAIDNGSSNITTTGTITGGTITTSGTVNFGSLSDGTITITAFVDEDDMASDSATLVPTQQSVKDYIASVTGGGGSTLTIQNQGSSLSTGAGTINFTGGGVVASGSGSTKTVTISGGIITTGSNNTGIGTNVFSNIDSSCDNNTAFGYGAGSNLSTAAVSGSGGDSNTLIGYNAKTADAYDSSTVVIGAEAWGSDGSVHIGHKAYGNAGGPGGSYGPNVIIGQEAGYYAGGQYSVILGGYAGYGLSSNENLKNNRSVIIGYQACYKGGQGRSVSIGYQAGYSLTCTGDYSGSGCANDLGVHIGQAAGYNITSGSSNVCIGYNAGNTITTGAYNIMIANSGGFSSGAIKTGAYNIGIGIRCFYQNSDATCQDNVAIGKYSQYKNVGLRNTSIGTEALEGNSDTTSEHHDDCTAVGNQALEIVTTGDNNTGLGSLAGNSITTGSNLTCVGYDSDASSATATNEITLGNNQVSTLRCNTQTISTLSDKRDKKNIEDIDIGLSFINDLRPVNFTWDRRDGSMNEVKSQGFIAQEVDEAQLKHNCEDHLQAVMKENTDKLEMSYGKFVPALVKALQELSAKNDALEARIKLLEG